MPALTKAKIVDNIYEAFQHSDYTVSQCTDVLEDLLEIIKRTLESGDDVMVSNFGRFQVKQKKQRKGRNPATGDDMMLPARRVVTFKCAGRLGLKVA